MFRNLIILFTALLAFSTGAESFEKVPLPELEQRLEEIDSKLAQLANYSLNSGIGAIGYRSSSYEIADHPEWLEIDFGKEVPLDEVMLIPAIRRDTENGFQADGFPMHFRLIAGTETDTNGMEIAEYRCDESILPRIAPFYIPCDRVNASWIRIEVEELSARAFDKRYVFQLSEIMAFSGSENVALHRPVKSSSSTAKVVAWDSSYVVDGFVPYLMDAAHGKQSVAYLSPEETEVPFSLTIDLGELVAVSRIHLHAVEQSDTLPQAYAGDFGIPKVLRIEKSDDPDFKTSEELLLLHPETIYKMGPIMMQHVPDSTCRYIRLTALEPSLNALYGKIPYRMGFAEIEVFSNGRNVALNRPIHINDSRLNPHRPIANLTDGRNMYGNILPIREWLNQLVMRHELERERPFVAAELNLRYTQQKDNLRRMGWLSVLLASGAIIIILVDRIIRQRVVYRTRERIAADLHDELGANIHAIGLLGDLAQAAKASPEKLDKLLPRMRALTERTGAAARYCTNLLEAEGLYEDLVEDMRKTAARVMADLDYRIEFEGEDFLSQLKPRKRIDLFLFYKECLINIIRHSGATRVRTQLTANSKQLSLAITDNGHGLNGDVPSSLKRRARLLGAQVSSTKSDSGGTCISLKLKLKKFGV